MTAPSHPLLYPPQTFPATAHLLATAWSLSCFLSLFLSVIYGCSLSASIAERWPLTAFLLQVFSPDAEHGLEAAIISCSVTSSPHFSPPKRA